MVCSETSVRYHQSAQHNVLEVPIYHLCRDGRLKSHFDVFLSIISPSRGCSVLYGSSNRLNISTMSCRGQLKCDVARAEIRFRLSCETEESTLSCRGQLKCDGTREEIRFRLLCETDESI